jgi:hypothetical protein
MAVSDHKRVYKVMLQNFFDYTDKKKICGNCPSVLGNSEVRCKDIYKEGLPIIHEENAQRFSLI